MNKLIIATLLFPFFVITGQVPINFAPKSLQKQIKKHWKMENFEIKEIDLSPEFTKSTKIKGKYFEVSDLDITNKKKYIYIGRVNSCRAGGCNTISNSTEGDYEYFDYFILFTENKTVEMVKVYNYQATHGHEITVKGWLKQFIGYKGKKDLQVGKDIDAIAGATISVHGITADVQHKTGLLGKITF